MFSRISIFIFASIGFAYSVNAQFLQPSVIGTLGGYSAPSTGPQLSYSMGETFTATFTNSSSILSQGFEQVFLSTAIVGSSTVCVGATITLSDSTPGGNWSSSNTAIATVGTSGIVTGIAPGSAVISYAFAGEAVTKTVNVLPTSLPSITGSSSMCIGSSTTFANAIAGGTWSSSNTAVATVGSVSGVITSIGPGSALISYVVPGCMGNITKTKNIAIKPLPSVSEIIGNIGAICANDTLALFDTTTAGSHIWTSSNPPVASVNLGSGVVTASMAGTTIISYNYTFNGCTNSTTTIVTVNPVTVPTVTGTLTLCMNGGTTLLSGIPEGGTWSSSSIARAIVDSSSGLVTGGTSSGSAIITYVYTNEYGCSASAKKSVTVNTLPGVATIGGASSIGVGASATLTDVTSGGVWSSSNTDVASVGTSGNVTGINPGTAVITYTVMDVNGCSAFKKKTITVTGARFSISPSQNTGNIFKIYPNPTTGLVYISASVEGHLKVYTVDGKEVLNYSVPQGETSFKLPANIADGIYVCNFYAANGKTATARLTYIR